MNNNIHIDKLLDDLLKGNLSLREVEQLMQLEAIADVAGEIDLHRFAAVALQRYSVLEQVQQVHKEYVEKARNDVGENKSNTSKSNTSAKVVRIQPLKWFMRVAAILILVAGGWVVYHYTTTSSTKLYTEIYQPYNINTDRNDNIEIVPHNMIQQFKDKDYAAVINTFRSMPATNNREKFLAAYAWHTTGDYKQVINVLQQILKNNNQTGNRLYNDEAEFYLGLSYLKMKNNKTAFTYFEKIRNDTTHTFHERVSKWTMMRLKWLK